MWGKELYFDSTHVHANTDLDSLAPRFAVEAREAVREHLDALFASEPAPCEPAEESLMDAPLPEPLPQDASRSLPTPLPVVLSETQREEIVVENAARHNWIAQEGRQQREIRGSYQRTSDVRISTADPDATPMRLKAGGTHLGYHTQYFVDGGKRRLILAVLVTPGEVMDNHPMQDLLWHTCFRWHLRPKQVTADSLYGTGENLQAIEEANIRAYIPVAGRGQHNMGYYGLAQFIYEADQDQYRCPQGQVLRPAYRMEGTQETQYRADAAICNICPVKAECTESPRGRHVHRSFFADSVERVKSYQQTFAYQKALRKRQVWVEPLFGEGKQWHGMGRFRLRRLWRVNGEALMIATGQNLKRLLQKRGWGRRPFPAEAGAGVPAPRSETDIFLKETLLTSRSASVAQAILSPYDVARACFETDRSRFSFALPVVSLSLFQKDSSVHFLPAFCSFL